MRLKHRSEGKALRVDRNIVEMTAESSISAMLCLRVQTMQVSVSE